MMNTDSRRWFILGVIALALSGIIAPLLILGRTIDNADGTTLKDYFQLSIIMHVNFGILMWLLSITIGYFKALKPGGALIPFWLAVAGTVLMALSSLGSGEAYSNNYIPMFDNTVFKAGIGLFLAAIMYESTTALVSHTDFRARTVAALIVIAFICFVASYLPIREQLSSHNFYETLFWGGGHVLQFAYVQIMLIAWLILSSRAEAPIYVSGKWQKIIFSLPVIFILATTTYIYAAHPVESAEHITAFTYQMIFGNSLAAIPLAFLLLLALLKNFRSFANAFYLTLFFSFTLFVLGGALGTKAAHAVAQGEITTIIPAHYHGSVIAVTVALMGLVYNYLPSIKNRWAALQISLYGTGQILHIVGMAILGGHGAQRKTVGLDYMQLTESTEKLIKSIMHGGGGLVAIGGFMFIVLTLKALIRNRQLSR